MLYISHFKVTGQIGWRRPEHPKWGTVGSVWTPGTALDGWTNSGTGSFGSRTYKQVPPILCYFQGQNRVTER